MIDEKLRKKQLRKDKFLEAQKIVKMQEFRQSILDISKQIDRYFYGKFHSTQYNKMV